MNATLQIHRPAWARLFVPWLLAACVLGVCSAARAADDGPALKDITYTALPGDRVRIELKLSSPPATEPLSFAIDNPARVAVDLPATRLALGKRSRKVGVGPVDSVTAVEASGRTRVVVNLVEPAPYEVETEGDTVRITIEGAAEAIAAATPETATMPGTARGAQILDVDFRRGPGGEGRVIVKLSDPAVPINIDEKGGQVVVDFLQATLPERLDRRLDVTDFATPVETVDLSPAPTGARMVIAPHGFYDHVAYQSDDVFTVEFRPLTKAEQEEVEKEKFGYTGERLSLNFQNIDVRAVLQLIADFTGLNMVASDTVTGTVTLRLKNVPWDQALDIILKSKGLGMRQTGNVIMVAPQEEIAQREKLELEAQKQIAELAPLRTEFVQINYAKASDIASLIKTEGNNLLTERGNVSVDERTNTLIIQETADKLAEIRKLVAKLDVPVRQVLIESRIVIANSDFSKELGVRFGYSKNSELKPGNDSTEFVFGGKTAGDIDFGGGTAFTTDDNENFIVNLPVPADPAAVAELAVGKIGSYLLQLELSALQQEGRGEVISSPRVVTANQKEAVIESGTDIPFQEATSSGATNVSFKKAVLSLRVTPHITPDDRVIMDLKVTKDSVGQIFAGVPSIDTRNVTTQVLVDNGETVVLGGIYETTNRNDVKRVPFFGDLPYLGWLFKRTQNTDNKDELLIFVTPKILKESIALR